MKFPLQIKLNTSAPWPEVNISEKVGKINKIDWITVYSNEDINKYKAVAKYLVIEEYIEPAKEIKTETIIEDALIDINKDASLSTEELDLLVKTINIQTTAPKPQKNRSIKELTKKELIANILNLSSDYEENYLVNLTKDEMLTIYSELI